MTRQRKTHLLFLALVPAVVFGALRCADSPSEPRAQSSQAAALEPSVAATLAKLHAQYDWIGEYHNDALKYVLANLQRLPAKSLNRRAICETALAAYAEFHRSRRHVEVPAEVVAAAEQRCSSSGLGVATGAFSLEIPGGLRMDELSPEAQSYMDQIVSAIDASNSSSDLNSAVAAIEATAATTLSKAEAADVIMVGSVTESSAQYWDANLADWLPYSSYTLEYSRASRSSAAGGDASTIAPAGVPRFSFWGDFKAAAKVAGKADGNAAIAAIVRESILSAVFSYDFVIGSAAVGSIMAVLQM
jgi:hypothetical protein